MTTRTKYVRRAHESPEGRADRRQMEVQSLAHRAMHFLEWEYYALDEGESEEDWESTFSYTEQMWRAVGAYMFYDWLEHDRAKESDRQLVADIKAWLSRDV